jgi:hypothetical protein
MSARCNCYNGHNSASGRCNTRNTPDGICDRCKADCRPRGLKVTYVTDEMLANAGITLPTLPKENER